MVHFVGAGCGAADLITVRGARLLSEADVVIYAGSLVNPELLKGTKEGCEIHDSARMTLPEVLGVMERAEAEKKTIVRLHTGDPSLYGAIRDQMDRLEEAPGSWRRWRQSLRKPGTGRTLRRPLSIRPHGRRKKPSAVRYRPLRKRRNGKGSERPP